MPTPSNYGADYSRFFIDDGSPVPFPHPVNDAQRQINARARADRAGRSIGSGYLNPQSGVLENPDDGLTTWIADHWPLVAGSIVAAPFAVGALGGGAGATTSVIPGTGIPIESGTAGLAGALPTAPAAAATTAKTIAGTTAAGTSALNKLRQSLTSGEGVAALASLIPLLTAGGSGGGASSGTGELARINAITEARMRRADPLHQVAVQLAFNRAPTSARNGITLQNVPLPQ